MIMCSDSESRDKATNKMSVGIAEVPHKFQDLSTNICIRGVQNTVLDADSMGCQ